MELPWPGEVSPEVPLGAPSSTDTRALERALIARLRKPSVRLEESEASKDSPLRLKSSSEFVQFVRRMRNGHVLILSEAKDLLINYAVGGSINVAMTSELWESIGALKGLWSTCRDSSNPLAVQEGRPRMNVTVNGVEILTCSPQAWEPLTQLQRLVERMFIGNRNFSVVCIPSSGASLHGRYVVDSSLGRAAERAPAVMVADHAPVRPTAGRLPGSIAINDANDLEGRISTSKGFRITSTDGDVRILVSKFGSGNHVELSPAAWDAIRTEPFLQGCAVPILDDNAVVDILVSGQLTHICGLDILIPLAKALLFGKRNFTMVSNTGVAAYHVPVGGGRRRAPSRPRRTSSKPRRSSSKRRRSSSKPRRRTGGSSC